MNTNFYSTKFDIGHDNYCPFYRASLRLPQISILTICFWLRKSNVANINECLIRTPACHFSNALLGLNVYVDGVAVQDQSFLTGKWQKVVLTGSDFNGGVFLSDESLVGFYSNADVADLRFYNRNFTSSELADTTINFPIDQIARFDFNTFQATNILEATLNGTVISIVGGTLTVPKVLTNGRFLFYGGAGSDLNSPGVLFDQSGNNKHMLQQNSAVAPSEMINSLGVPYFAMVGQNPGTDVYWWNSQLYTSSPSDYTFYMVVDLVDPTSMSNCLFDTINHGLLLSTGSDKGVLFTNDHGMVGLNSFVIPAGKSLITWNLSLTGGTRIYVNRALVFVGIYNRVSLNGGRLGADNVYQSIAYINDKLFCFAVTDVSDSNEDMFKTWNKLSDLYDLDSSAAPTGLLNDPNFDKRKTVSWDLTGQPGWYIDSGYLCTSTQTLNASQYVESYQKLRKPIQSNKLYQLQIYVEHLKAGEFYASIKNGCVNVKVNKLGLNRFNFTGVSTGDTSFVLQSGTADSTLRISWIQIVEYNQTVY